jgi:hypothetical protein
LHGTVEKIITSRWSSETEKAQISINGVDELYKQLRIENRLTDEGGNQVRAARSHPEDNRRGRAAGYRRKRLSFQSRRARALILKEG